MSNEELQELIEYYESQELEWDNDWRDENGDF